MTLSPPSWLCPQASDRDRLLDMDHRLKPVRAAAILVLAVALVIAAADNRVGWWTLVPLLFAGAGFALAERGLDRRARPEYTVGAAWLTAQVAIAFSIALSGSVGSPATAWLVLPVVTLPARFTTRGVAAGVAATALLMLLATVALEPAAAAAAPEHVMFPLALLIGVAILSTALMRSDVQHRGEAIIDPLTGMLNRGALQGRLPELAAQAEINQRPVGVVVLDLDHFKAVNDGHGHATGDTVLREVAYRIRKHLRAYDLAYRLGGEEFLVVLPGADVEESSEIAEGLRLAIEQTPIVGLTCTASCGVSASLPGVLDYPAAFAAADGALYDAKAAGRNQVRAVALDERGSRGELRVAAAAG